MNDNELLRYSRHILLDEIGFEGQAALLNAKVLVVGCGGLGASVLPYLAASGIGQLFLADDDEIELSNLQRQIMFTQHDIGQNKADVMAKRLANLNDTIRISAIPRKLLSADLVALILEHKIDVVVDCTDNFPTRQAINLAICQTKISLVSGAAVRFNGQISVYQPHLGSACYHCLFSGNEASDGACATFGVFAPLVGIIGSVQAAITLKLLLGIGEIPVNQLLTYDAIKGTWQSFGIEANPACTCCQSIRN